MKKGYRICFVEIKHTSKCISNPGNEKRSMLQLKRNSQGEKQSKSQLENSVEQFQDMLQLRGVLLCTNPAPHQMSMV